jgi:RNA polymerase sigma factor (TIGR02999 family)
VDPAAPEPTQLLQRASAGEPGASERLFHLVYGELLRLAQRMMEDERTGHTLQATALVHEAWLKLFQGERPAEWSDRGQFLRAAGTAMRRVLVDHARTRGRAKRGGGAERLLLDDALEQVEQDGGLNVLAVHEALERLTALDEQAANIVELRFFGGLSIAETAQALGLSTATVERGWRVARLWLARDLGLEPTGQ